MTNGYSVLGNVDKGRGVLDATNDEKSVMFSEFHLAEFIAIKRHIEERIVSVNAYRHLLPAIDRVDQLKRLAELHTAGVLTDDEFAAENAKILGAS
jgi:hypothetical protein